MPTCQHRAASAVVVVLLCWSVATETIAQQPNYDDGPSPSDPQQPSQRDEPSQAQTEQRQDRDSRSRRRRTQRRRSRRLASTPPVFGDLFTIGTINANTGANFVTADLPLAGGARRAKVAENNLALPQNRVFYFQNYFQNAAQLQQFLVLNGPPVFTRNASIQRYTAGFETTFDNESWSLEVRMPFTSGFSHADGTFVMAGGNVGNLSLFLKKLVYRCGECAAASVGLGVDTPTGNDVQGLLPILNVAFTAENESVHLLPFAAVMSNPSERVFWQAFAQLDVPLNSSRVSVVNLNNANFQTGRLTEQVLLHLDISTGVWLHRNRCAPLITGIAGLLEVHYTTALQGADLVPLFGGLVNFGNPQQRNVVNLTGGVHLEIARQTQLRFAAVVPLGGANNRFFDNEIIAALIRRY